MQWCICERLYPPLQSLYSQIQFAKRADKFFQIGIVIQVVCHRESTEVTDAY